MAKNTRKTGRTATVADFAVVGLGQTGQAALRFLTRMGASVVALDTRAEPPGLDQIKSVYPELQLRLGGLDAGLLQRCEHVIVSPGVSPHEPGLQAAYAAGVELVSDIELFARHAAAPVIAITGTNGKSTVTTLVADMLEADGRTTCRGGNLGTPALALLELPDPDIYVLELSSFQLELTSALAPQVACILNISPDHLDRHGTVENYVSAKARILTHAENAVLNADDVILRAYQCTGRRFEFSVGTPGPERYGVTERDGARFIARHDHDFAAWSDINLSGEHNLANAVAATAIADIAGADSDAISNALRNFRGLPHRAVAVAEIDGVQYVNDSKATNVGAASASIGGLMRTRSGVVIAGGVGKGGAYDTFAETVAAHAHTVVLIGQAAAEIGDALRGKVQVIFATDMRAAVRNAARAAQPGEMVVLAPACASFDQFEDYRARGDAFCSAVAQLGRAQ